jgi:5-methylcytosine-specific restriction endonuclease McrA
MNNPKNPKERNLLKGAMRRVFSRSDLRRKALEKHDIDYQDPERPRVTKWSFCGECGVIEPRYKMEVDHVSPVIKLDEALEDLTWDQLVDRLWCDEANLKPICKECHKRKSKAENKERRRIRSEKS